MFCTLHTVRTSGKVGNSAPEASVLGCDLSLRSLLPLKCLIQPVSLETWVEGELPGGRRAGQWPSTTAFIAEWGLFRRPDAVPALPGGEG